MSEAEKAVYDEFVLFQKTKNGKTIFSDRSVEWSIRDIRQRVGKFFNDALPAKLNSIVLEMENIKKWNDVNGEVDGAAQKSKKCEIKLDNAFIEPYLFCELANIWLGKPMAVQPKPFFDRVNCQGEETGLELLGSSENLYSPSGTKIFKDVLFTISQGFERSKNYFEKFHVYGDLNEASRPHKLTDLKQVMVNDNTMKVELMLAVSLDADELKTSRVYTVERLKEEIQLLNKRLSDLGMNKLLAPSRGKKEIYARLLVDGRKKIKELDPMNWEDQEKQKMRARLEGADKSATEIIRNELDHTFFTFAGSNSLCHQIGKEKINIDLNPNRRDSTSAAFDLCTLDESFHNLMLQTYEEIL